MLPRGYRTDRKLLEKLFSRAPKPFFRSTVRHGRSCSLRIVDYPCKPAKTAFIVSAKVAKKAVTRNLVKRRARGIVMKLCSRLPHDRVFIFTFNKAATTTSFKEFERDILALLQGERKK
ncbi:MAG: hypothetical protein COV10_03900 [Candidatus Vogelbacteria bacterium CG10_big_fil_rev_8_21_14_0_10_51_16]|uniref:Uncharacterized protein n=1 Tax=Candidatus Vogelbacteria bacterium CG10_big_fil_rev_8_21_14_0_10_51_16 TaxID=1975045 RepID=A0A2H0RDM5_9BACT|nr:MAG: hypothetical protein COV10_03900 [Candidatus Vogelbacteria bacterium CG10_big_fil_rev_8_21_14_0_10_51_16]